MSDAFLVSGDEDLREGVRVAQDMGVRVTLLGIASVGQAFNQSRDLVHEADEVVELTKSQLAPFIWRRNTVPTTGAIPTSDPWWSTTDRSI